MASAVSLKHVIKSYRRGREKVEVLHALDLDIPEGEFLALMGPSGSGKTTILNLIGGLDRADSGEVIVGGENLQSLSGGQLAKWRTRHVGFIFQFYNLMPMLSAAANVELPLLLTNLSKAERRKHVAVALEMVGLSEREAHKPGEMSGGQQQRVGIARAIVADPTLLLCDEPTGDLDRKTADEILDLLQRAQPASQQDHCDGDPRSQGRRPCRAPASFRQGKADRGAGNCVKYFPLIWAALWRKPTRLILTLLSVTVAFLLFGITTGISASYAHLVELSHLNRIYVSPRFGGVMPLAMGEQLARLDGVTDVGAFANLLGYYQDKKNNLSVIMMNQGMRKVFTELPLTPQQWDELFSSRTGVFVSRLRAEKLHLKAGDTFPMIAQFPVREDKSNTWTFTVLALVDDIPQASNGFMVGDYDYLDQAILASQRSTVFGYQISDPRPGPRCGHRQTN